MPAPAITSGRVIAVYDRTVWSKADVKVVVGGLRRFLKESNDWVSLFPYLEVRLEIERWVTFHCLQDGSLLTICLSPRLPRPHLDARQIP